MVKNAANRKLINEDNCLPTQNKTEKASECEDVTQQRSQKSTSKRHITKILKKAHNYKQKQRRPNITKKFGKLASSKSLNRTPSSVVNNNFKSGDNRDACGTLKKSTSRNKEGDFLSGTRRCVKRVNTGRLTAADLISRDHRKIFRISGVTEAEVHDFWDAENLRAVEALDSKHCLCPAGVSDLKRVVSSQNEGLDAIIARDYTAPARATTITKRKTRAQTRIIPTIKSEVVADRSRNRSRRARIMSLYEGRGVVTNGYLSSTRNSSAGQLHSSEADNQDVINQYLPSPSSVTTTGNGSSASLAPSMATLCNIGNTCYLNSVVYTLRFAPQFLHNLHHLVVDLNTIQHNIARQRTKSSSLGRGLNAVHMENARSWSSKDLASLDQYNNSAASGSGGAHGASALQKSSSQLLTERLHELYQSLHRNEVTESGEPFHADTLLHAIQDVCAIFEGNQQQDAHEVLMCVLNSIRDTCQTLIRTVSECPEVILNSYMLNTDEVDNSVALDRESSISAENQTFSSGVGSSSSSPSTSITTKASFFSRKSKRKDESKSAKNSRLHLPFKDGSNAVPEHQPTSNSLFYLNTIDLTGSNAHSSSDSSTTSTTGASAIWTPATKVSDQERVPANLLKDKERLAEKIRDLGLDMFTEDFEGVTVATTKCLSCETITEQKESMIDIAVPVPISGYDNADYMDKPSSFIQNSCVTREYFRGENKYRCEQCTGYTEAIRSISYEVLPRLLIIQLSRFSGGMEKISSYMPTSFTLSCFCSKCCELSDASKLHVYKLYSVITHVGATMTVGHYIAYTCSLDWAKEYINCPKDRRMTQIQQHQQQQQQQHSINISSLQNNGTSGESGGVFERTHLLQSSAANAAASALASSGTSLIKKMRFGRNKTSSSNDMSKSLKNLNGLTSKSITNGIGRLSMNTTCHSHNCCALRFCSAQQPPQKLGSITSDLGEDSLQNTSTHSGSTSLNSCYNSFASGYGSMGRSSVSQITSSLVEAPINSEPIWYMCDDDKIKAMTQREFEDLLSPDRKITVTPYLLFYARFDLQQPSAQPTLLKQMSPAPTLPPQSF